MKEQIKEKREKKRPKLKGKKKSRTKLCRKRAELKAELTLTHVLAVTKNTFKTMTTTNSKRTKIKENNNKKKLAALKIAEQFADWLTVFTFVGFSLALRPEHVLIFVVVIVLPVFICLFQKAKRNYSFARNDFTA